MSSHIDLNKPPQGMGNSITPDWTTLNNQSDPFYLKAEQKTVNGATLNLENRYAITVVTDYKSTGKSRSDLQERLNKKENKDKGFVRILNYYDKNPGNADSRANIFQNVIVEDWDIKPRPNSRLKILVSISAVQIDDLPGILEGNLGLENAAYKVNLNTEDFYKKVNNLRDLLGKYDSDTRKLFGRIPNLNFKSQSTKVNEAIPALAKLMLDNGYTYSRGSDQEIIFGMTSDYKPSYVVLRDNKCYKPLDTNFDNFRRTVSFSDSRTNKLLLNIDKIDKEIKDLDKISIKDFIDEYIYNPPKFDFSSTKPFSEPEKSDVKIAKEKADEKTAKTYTDYTTEERLFGSEEFKNELRKTLETSSEFVGDNIIGGLRELSNLTPSVNSLYDKVLNKVPLRALIEAALECLNFRVGDLLNASKRFLNQAASLAEEIKNTIFDVPAIYLKDDLPITDYLEGIYESIKNGIIRALISTLFTLVIEIIKMLLDYCKECALGDERDGLNFGGLSFDSVLGGGAQTFTAAAVGAIQTGIYSARFPIPGGGSTSVAEQQQKVITQTQRSAQNPLLLPGELELYNKTTNSGYKKYVGDEKLQEDLNRQAEQSKQEMSGFLGAASSILTPAEAGNMMLGCGVGQEAIDAVRNLAENYPTISPLMQNDEDILGFFNDVGKLSGYPVVLETVKEITDRLPEEFDCLCDPDNTQLREQLLSKKDMDPELIKEQIQASNDRDKKRLEELNALLEKENILDGLVPPIYCSYDSKTGKVKQGLINRDHPKFTFTLDQTLNTLYDSVATTFNRDVDGYIPTVTISPTVERIIPRTVERVINNKKTVLFNNEFLDLVGKGQFSFGALPPGVKNETNTETLEQGNQNGYGTGDDNFKFVHWLGSPRIDQEYGTQYSGKTAEELAQEGAAIGMTQPFPESEQYYEAINRDLNFYNPESDSYRKAKGGRNDPNGFYTRKYGFSPVPIVVKERGQEEYAPGFKEAYRTFCFREPENSDLGKISIVDFEQESQRYKFNVPNKLLDNLNIDLEALKGSSTQFKIDSSFFTEQDTGGRVGRQEIGEGFQEALSGLFGKINDLGFSLNYYVPYEWTNRVEETLDQFSFVVSADTPEAFRDEAGGPDQLELNAIVSGPNEKINTKAVDCYMNRSLTPLPTGNLTPQEKFFKNLIQDSFKNGPTVYSNLEKTSNWKDQFYNQSPASIQVMQNLVIDENKKENLNYYNELWQDIFCSFTNQISSQENPFFDLANLNNLQLSPMKIEQQECPPHLLDIDAIKNRIKQEYSVIQCLEASFPNTDGLGSNKDNPFEKANLGGTILLILRTYITEMFLRSLHVFYWFRYKQPKDVDPLMVLYVGRYITSDIEKQGYFAEFEKEVLDLYNRNVDLPLDQDGKRVPETDYDVAIKFLVQQQIWSVSNRISKLVGSRGDTSIDSILLEEWIRLEHIQRQPSAPRLDKPCSSASNEIPYVTQELLEMIENGELSIEGIELAQIVNNQAPVGYLFREYFSSPPQGRGAADQIWSLNTDSNYVVDPGKTLNDGSVIGNKLTKPPSPNWSESKISANREASILSSSRVGRLMQLKEVWSSYEETIKRLTESPNTQGFKAFVSENEKRGIYQLLKLISMNAEPDNYLRSDGYENGTITVSTSTGGSESWYPGKLFRTRMSNQIRDGREIDLPQTVGADINTPATNFISDGTNGFFTIFGEDARAYGFNSHNVGDRIDAYYKFANDGTYAYILNNEFFEMSARTADLPIYNSNQLYSPLPNVTDKGKPFYNALVPAADEVVRKYLNNSTAQPLWTIDGPARDNFNDSVRESGNFLEFTDYAGDNIEWRFEYPQNYFVEIQGSNFPAENTRAPGDIYYLGNEHYFLGSFRQNNGFRKAYVGVENFAPRLITDLNNKTFKFYWRFGKELWKDTVEQGGGNSLIAYSDPWMYVGNADKFRTHPKYFQYGIPQFDDQLGYYTLPEGPGAGLGGSFPDNLIQENILVFANSVLGARTVLNPQGNRGNYYAKPFYHAFGWTMNGLYKYVSLLDLDPQSILNVLTWERGQIYEDPRFNLENTTGDTPFGRFDDRRRTKTYQLTEEGERLVEAYDGWIREWSEAVESFSNTSSGRNLIREDVFNKINFLPLSRRPMETPLTCDYTNGGLILEPYIRAIELNTDQNSPYNENVTNAGFRNKQANKDKVDRAKANNLFGRTGIINIDEFDDFVHQITQGAPIERSVQESEEVLNNSCGQNLPSASPSRNYEYSGVVLGDYFEEVHIGLRLSYVMPIREGTTSEIENDLSQLNSLFPEYTSEYLTKTKAYFVKEEKGGKTRTLNIVPISTVEIPFNMTTRMDDVLSTYPNSSPPRIDENGFFIEEPQTESRFFKSIYERNLRTLTNQMSQTEDYSLMFKYLFPIDKMLSINNVYSNTYLSTIRNIDTVFDATKEELRQLLFILLDSGNYEKSKCAPTNRDIMESLLNGFDIKGLSGQLAIILLKSSVLIFKGFMETADINILLSRRIIDLIHTVNKFIAQSQQLINQGAQAVSDTAAGISDLGNSIYGAATDLYFGTSCKDLIAPGSCKSSSKVSPTRPDASLFDPIEENFIPEPQIWAVSLALLPATLFAPFFFGPPLTLPFGFVYWALDYKPDPNWLNSTPPADWLTKLLNGEGQIGGTAYSPLDPNQNCSADLGLPPPGANAQRLNEYYSEQNLPPPEPIPSQITGSSGTASQIPSEARIETWGTVEEPKDKIPVEKLSTKSDEEEDSGVINEDFDPL